MKTLVISPSGKFYGSEQFLFDYLKATSLQCDILVPNHGDFQDKLKTLESHKVMTFSPDRIKRLYLKVFIRLMRGRYRSVYCNEAGHSRYLILLSTIFKRVKFFIHIRINEDTDPSRWPKSLPPNVTVLIMSKFLQQQFHLESVLLYDLYEFKKHEIQQRNPVEHMKIGVVGRITLTKGIHHLYNLLIYLKERNIKDFTFLLYGDFGEDVIRNGMKEEFEENPQVQVMGFCADKTQMYQSFHCLMHFCETEPLGRIILEAIEYEMPFIGFDAGGIGEIGRVTGLPDFLVEMKENLYAGLIEKMTDIKINYPHKVKRIQLQKPQAASVFNIGNYVRSLDQSFSGNGG